MRGNRYFTILVSTGLISGIALALLILNVNPRLNPYIGLGLFFPVLFLFLVSLFSLLGFYVRKIFFNSKYFYSQIVTSIRQAVFLSLLVEFSLVFSLVNVFNWFTGLLLIFVFLILEFYFSEKETRG